MYTAHSEGFTEQCPSELMSLVTRSKGQKKSAQKTSISNNPFHPYLTLPPCH